ncbi:hypothetical protein HON58_03670 [Candidatus Peregrinibacteria bacterium]|nr:hypothetical protein [Candidatus Peregrinibacteria bacterium]
MNKRNLKQLTVLFALIGIIIMIHLMTPKIIAFQQRMNLEKARIQTLEKINEIKNIETTDRAYLEVKFICQAPLQTEENWTHHEESCEEAALLQAITYEENNEITPEEADEIIKDMISWQNDNFGEHKDLYADDMKRFITEYYNLEDEEVIITPNATVNDIKKAVLDGHPVIVPITGEILKNPYYPYPGYHMLTVIGFTEDKIITNDNGTRKGKDFSYDISVFEKAFKDAGGDIITLSLSKNSPPLQP